MRNKERLILVGTGQAAFYVMSFLKKHELFDVIGFAVNDAYRTCDTFLGLPVYSLERLEKEIAGDFRVFVTLHWNRLNADRVKVFNYCRERGFKFASLISPLSQSYAGKIGENCFIGDFTLLADGCVVGDNVVCHGQNYVGSEAVVGSHSYMSVKSSIGGFTIVGNQSYLGMNSCVFQQVKIGNKCLVGGGAVVKRDLPDYSSIRVLDESMGIKHYDADTIESKLIAGRYRK